MFLKVVLLSLVVDAWPGHFSRENSLKVLQTYGVYNKRMVRDDSVRAKSQNIEWTDWSSSKCNWRGKCSHDFLEYIYHQDGNKQLPPYIVHVAHGTSAPHEFNTLGWNNMLNAALFDMSSTRAIVFVIMPSDWDIYQHRFKSQTVRELATAVAAGGVSFGAGSAIMLAATAGAGLGSVIPGPGTAVGFAIGAAGAAGGAAASYVFNNMQDDYFGHFLRHLG